MGRFSRILAAAVVIAAAAVVIVATAVVAVAAALTVVAAAAEQQKQNDDPAEIATTETIVTHKNTSRSFFAVITAHSMVFRHPKNVTVLWGGGISLKRKCGIHAGDNVQYFSSDRMFPLERMGTQ